ncbi:hypothetical protein BDB01DRAFT_702560, partial [Pilobolus umbonatus]
LVPVIVEIQNKVNHPFVAQAIRCCMNTFDDANTLPLLVAISINSFSNKEFRELAFDKSDDNPFLKASLP